VSAHDLFAAPILRGLAERDRDAVLSVARFADLRAGEVVYGADAAADSVFVVLEGAVRLSAQRRGDVRDSVIRVARAGESFGEDALSFGGTRRITASAAQEARIAEVPKTVLLRALTRSGAEANVGRELRFAERSAIADLLKTVAFARELTDVDFEILLDGSRRKTVPRGERVYSAGDRAEAFFLIVDGLVQLQRTNGRTPEVRAYLGRGDFFGDEEIVSREARGLHAVATGPCELVEVPAAVLLTLADRNPRLLARVRRIQTDRSAAQAQALSPNATQHVLKDAYRMQMARSLLAIDQDTCVRCGHCAWTCESVHGVSRLVRRGDKVVTALATVNGARSLMLPSSCQHCKNPLCMVDCPTGAIGRDPDGEVFIREELCTGCGNCAKGCPWDNIKMAPRGDESLPVVGLARASDSAATSLSADVAVKCDLCRAYDSPACVSACPTQSIFRLEPAQDIAEVAAVFGSSSSDAPREHTAKARGLEVALASGLGLGLGAAGWILHARGAIEPGAGIGRASGWIALASIVLLVLYAVPKRFPRLWLRPRERGRDAKPARSRVRPFYRAHLALGALSAAAVMIHAGPHVPASIAGALGVSFWAVAGLGVLGALLYRFVPSRLSRLEHKGTLPEDTLREKEKLLDRLHREASGKSELVKALLERVLLPYARSLLGPWSLLASGRSQREEERELAARMDALLEGRGKDKREGLDELARTVVELRALPVRIWLGRALRGWLIAHLVLTGALVVLLVLHLAGSV
jgi:Fe-S-cluster-containing dehydrogenase component